MQPTTLISAGEARVCNSTRSQNQTARMSASEEEEPQSRKTRMKQTPYVVLALHELLKDLKKKEGDEEEEGAVAAPGRLPECHGFPGQVKHVRPRRDGSVRL